MGSVDAENINARLNQDRELLRRFAGGANGRDDFRAGVVQRWAGHMGSLGLGTAIVKVRVTPFSGSLPRVVIPIHG